MSGTIKTDAALLAEFPDNTTQLVVPADSRDLIVSKRSVIPTPRTVTGNATLQISDVGAIIIVNSASPCTLTIPTNAGVAIPVNAVIEVLQVGAGAATFTPAGGVTMITPPPSGTATSGVGAHVFMYQYAANSWSLTNDLAPSSGSGIQAIRVNDLYGTLGINLQTATYTNVNLTTSTFSATGARVFRDNPNMAAGSLAVFQALVNAGFRMITPMGLGQNPVLSTDITQLKTLAAMGPKALWGYEGPNEPVNWPITYNGQTQSTVNTHPGFEPLVQYQRDLWLAVNADATLGPLALQMGTASLAGYAQPDNSGEQFLTVPVGVNTVTLVTNNTTANGNGTLHFSSVPTTTNAAVQVGAYVYGVGIAANTTVVSTTSNTVVIAPVSSGGVANGASIRFGCKVADGTVLATILNQHSYPLQQQAQGEFVDASDTIQTVNPNAFTHEAVSEFVTTGTVPSGGGNYAGYASVAVAFQNPHIITEAGLQSAASPIGNAQNVSLDIQGKNLMTGWLAATQHYGYELFCIYALFDDSNGNFGLFDNSGNAKLAGTYFSNLFTVIQDIGASKATFLASSLSYTITGLPAGGNSALTQVSGGTFFLVIWNEVQSWNFASGVAIAVGGSSVVVTFSRSGSIHVYDPIMGTTAQQTLTANTVTVSLTDHPLVVSFV